MMEEKRSKWEGFKDFVVGIRVATIFLICVAVGAGLLLLFGIGFAIISPIFIAILTIALFIALGLLALIVSYFVVKRVGRTLRKRRGR